MPNITNTKTAHPGKQNMARNKVAEARKQQHASISGWLSAMLLIAVSLPANADTTQTDPAPFQHLYPHRGGVGGTESSPLPRNSSQLSCLGELVCADPPPEVSLQARELAYQVLEQVYALPDAEKRYFLEMRRNAVGFAIFPNVQRQGFMVAKLYGRGILSVSDPAGGWSPPILLTLQGQSLGPQFGAQSSNVIIIFRTVGGIKDLLSGHHHIIAHTSGAAVEHVDHAADPLGITVHFFDRGGMFGQSSDSYAIHIDEETNAALYGMTLKPGNIVEGTRSGFKAPWMLRYMQNMQLPPGQAHRTLELE
jgi:lipid-binding SYLF domain-containing protein